jgi:hypothetical protein
MHVPCRLSDHEACQTTPAREEKGEAPPAAAVRCEVGEALGYSLNLLFLATESHFVHWTRRGPAAVVLVGETLPIYRLSSTTVEGYPALNGC